MSGSMDVLPDEVAQLVLDTFDSLEQKRKPLIRSDGAKEMGTTKWHRRAKSVIYGDLSI